jgi:hypothetical protein
VGDSDYGGAGEISEDEAGEILTEAKAFRSDAIGWLRRNHPKFVPK